MRIELSRGMGALALVASVALVAGCPELDPLATTSQTIGPEGGGVSSADGRLVIEVPAGAFSEATLVTIEPLEANDCPRGVGAAYRLTPEGTTFLKPVKLTVQYEEGELGGVSPGGLGVAFQGPDGTWSARFRRELDPDARKVTVETDHFSVWSLFEMFVLEPSAATVKVRATQELKVLSCVAETDPETLVTALVPTCNPFASPSLLQGWAVNGTPGGSADLGTIAAQGAAATATFTAPARLPTPNPVAVSVEVNLPGTAKGLLVSNLTIENECPAPICRFAGTSQLKVLTGDTLWVSGTAQATWQYSRTVGTRTYYAPSGTATAAWAEASCTISLSPSTFTIAPTDGELTVDFTANPPTWSGFGSSGSDSGVQTWTCPNDTPFTEQGVHADWFGGSGTLSQGTTLQGEVKTADREGSWSFTAQ